MVVADGFYLQLLASLLRRPVCRAMSLFMMMFVVVCVFVGGGVLNAFVVMGVVGVFDSWNYFFHIYLLISVFAVIF